MKKNLGGRPKLKRGTDKAAVIAVRMTKTERKTLETAWKEWARHRPDDWPRKLSDWVRTVLLDSALMGTKMKAGLVNAEDAGIEPHGADTP